MNREEHLQWCKDRALEYLNDGDTSSAVASFTSDMSKHPETAKHPALSLGIALLLGKQLDTKAEMDKWINGFN